MLFKNLSLLIFMLILLPVAKSANYDTLPKGARLLAIRHVDTSPVGEYWNRNSQRSSYGQDINFNAELLGANPLIHDAFFATLYQVDPQAAANFTASEWKLEVNSDVKVIGFGGGYGITDKLTVYGFTSFYKAKVNMNAVKVRDGNFAETQDAIDSGSGRSGIVIDAQTFSFITGQTIQNTITNDYGYEPLGTWEAQGMGDIELGFKYLLKKTPKGGISAAFGTIAPIGRTDDPDILQDFAFGNGFWSTFVEFESAYHFNKSLDLEVLARYSYQFPTSVQERIPTEQDSALSDEKGFFDYYPGMRWDLWIATPYKILSWLTFSPKYIFEYDQQDIYDSKHLAANYWLGLDSQKIAHKYRLELVTDTLNAYFQKKFPLPFMAKITYEKVFEGTNVPDVARSELELRLFF